MAAPRSLKYHIPHFLSGIGRRRPLTITALPEKEKAPIAGPP
jgi:hypothetical protein